MRSVLLTTTCCAMVIFATACGELHQLPPHKVADGPYISSNREFSINIPENDVTVAPRSQPDFLTVDFSTHNPLNGTKVYSVEWTVFPEGALLTEAAFYKDWGDFLPKYLSGNFGNGHYSLLYQERGKFGQNYPMLRFIASGTNNGGATGSIYGTVINFGKRVAVVYAIRIGAQQEVTNPDSLPDFGAYTNFLQSLQCLRACNQIK
jgi:hypothetical protein